MANRRTAFLVASPLAAAAIAAALFFARGVKVETSMYAMLGDNAEAIPKDIRETSEATATAICSSGSAAVSRDAAERVSRRVAGFLDEEEDNEKLRRLVADLSGMVSPEDAARLATPEGRAKIAKAAIRRYYSSPVPPLFSPSDDPFCLKERYIMSLAESPVQLSPLRLRPEVAHDPDALADFRRGLEAAAASVEAELAGDGTPVEISFCGPLVHTAVAAERCKREIGALTVFSVCFIAVLSFAVFKSAKWLLMLAATLAA